ncbi:MATE family efflux transporter [Cellulophaga sp. BC115SP]|uniref:MATE family efflux transporter n=1 Tax=Cellulophaga sp. BC115SP TaxID=2683263 RepID=UPI00141302D6|nr:MATE family efflux transporter [Cellulophaga sp. BC115SP]NBB31613.1 hypothetical protein [Cellulophaga sp. BC115SP]
MFISLYSTRLILNALGNSDFGVFNIVGGAIAMLGFLNASLASATQRFMSYSEGKGDLEKKRKIFTISFTLHTILGILIGLLLFIAGFFFFNGILNVLPERIYAAQIVYGCLIISSSLTVMTVPYEALLNSHENMLFYSFVGVLESILKLLTALFISHFNGDRLILYGILMSAIPLFNISLMRIYCRLKYDECKVNFGYIKEKEIVIEMLKFAGWNFASTFSSITSAYGQNIVLNHFFGSTLNAAQGIANQTSGQLQVLSSNMLRALNPVLGKSAGANNVKLLRDSTLIGSKFATLLFILLAVPVFFQTPIILQLWLKNVPSWSILFVRFQLIKTFIEFQFNLVVTAISANGRIKEFSKASTISNLIQLPVIILLFTHGFPAYSMFLVSILLGNIVVYLFAMHYARRYCAFGWREYTNVVSARIYPVLVLKILFLLLYSKLFVISSLLGVLYFFMFSSILFVSLSFLMGCTKNERLLVISFTKKLLNY